MKNIIFRFFGLGLLFFTSGICKAQYALAPQQKGQLWTVAVHRGWPDYAPTQSWSTHEDFYTWLDQQKATPAEEIKQLKQDVIPFIRKTYSHNDATPAELAKALEILLPDLLSKKNRPLAASEQTDLQQQLSAVVKQPTADTTKRKATATGALPAATESVTKPVDSLAIKTTSAEMKNPTSTTIPENNSLLYGLGGLLLGFGAGFLFGRRSSGSGGPESTTSYPAANSSRSVDKEEIDWTPRKSKTTALPPADAWSEKPATENTSRRKQVPAEVEPTAQPESETPSTETGHSVGTEILFDIPPVAPVASTNLYGPAPDTPSIEARKLTPQSFPQMPICLRLANPQAAVGSFVLNPHAEQSRLIGNGIRELKAFFEFDLPLPDNFSTITTSKAGKMELRNDTWHLVEKAKIELK